MMTAKLAASVATVACANVENLVSLDVAKRHRVEIYANGDLEVKVIRRPGKVLVKLAKHGVSAEFSTRHGDTLRSVGTIVDLLLAAETITSARKYMKKVCRDSKRAPN